MFFVNDEKWLYDSQEEALLEAWEDAIHNKEEILAEIDGIKAIWEEASKNDSSHSVGYYRVLLSLIDRFRDTVREARLFDAQEYWGYNILIGCEGITLSIECTDSCWGGSEYEDEYPESVDPDSITYFTNASYDLIKVESNKLTVDEYAAIYDVNPVTVRQWIRRGKIRCAIKRGNEWRIPELYDLPKRGYRSTAYLIKESVPNLPSEYSFLNDYNTVFIDQDDVDKNQFIITLQKADETTKELKLAMKEKEKFELFLISCPQIKWVDETAFWYSQRTVKDSK